MGGVGKFLFHGEEKLRAIAMSLMSGIAYGLALWGVMYWIVLPQRWPTMFPVDPRLDPKGFAEDLFSHIVLVGIPIALVARSASRWRFTSDY